jgi:hypothetical protein
MRRNSENKQEAEEAKRRAQEALKVEDSEFSQFEDSDDSPLHRSKMGRSKFGNNKEIKDIKDKFGKKFLDIFQRSLMEIIQKTGASVADGVGGRSGNLNLANTGNYYSTSGGKFYSSSGQELPQFLVYNYKNYDSIYKLNNHGSNEDFIPLQTDGFSTLQGNLDLYRKSGKLLTRRQIQKIWVPQKYWPNGRPRGSLERTSAGYKNKYWDYQTQGLQSGIQGKSLQRHHRISSSIENQQKLHHSSLDSPPHPRLSGDQLLLAIEKLSSKFGTPFTVKGHKEQFVNYINKDPFLKENLLAQLSGHQNKSHFSVPMSMEKSRPTLMTKNPMSNITVKKSSPGIHISSYLPSADGVPNKKYLVNYMNAKTSEKEKIINLFSKLFKEYNFNKKEDKDLVLRHIR